MSISWVHENKKEFLSWINETFAEYKFTNKTTIEGKKMFKFPLNKFKF